MIKELKYFFYIFTIVVFIIFIANYYFSDENKKKSYRSIKLFEKRIIEYSSKLQTLESNTDKIIDYVENTKNKDKKNINFGNYCLMIKNRKAIIVGIKSTNLSKKEKLFLNKYKPWGVILFSRNLKKFNQIQKLITDIKSIFKDNKYPILIDQEGERLID